MGRGLLKGKRYEVVFYLHPRALRITRHRDGFIHLQEKPLASPLEDTGRCNATSPRAALSVPSSPPPPQTPKTLFCSGSARFSGRGRWLVVCLPLLGCGRGCLEIVNPKNAAGFLARWEGDGVGL